MAEVEEEGEEGDDEDDVYTPCSHGCWRDCLAVARLAGSYSSIGRSKELSAAASSAGRWYFSLSTSSSGQYWRLPMYLSLPSRLKYRRAYLPREAIAFGMLPSVSMNCAR